MDYIRLYVAARSAIGGRPQGRRKQPRKSYMQSMQKPYAPSAEQQRGAFDLPPGMGIPPGAINYFTRPPCCWLSIFTSLIQFTLNILTPYINTIFVLNPSLAENSMPFLSKQCKEEANCSGCALSAIQYLNLYQQPGSSNLIG